MALRIAVRALWHLATNSRCWSSRQAALIALKAIALTGEVESENGLPDDPPLAADERPDLLHPAQLEDFMRLWSGSVPR